VFPRTRKKGGKGKSHHFYRERPSCENRKVNLREGGATDLRGSHPDLEKECPIRKGNLTTAAKQEPIPTEKKDDRGNQRGGNNLLSPECLRQGRVTFRSQTTNEVAASSELEWGGE